jgi:hypothetical protein
MINPPPLRDPLDAPTWVVWFQSVYGAISRPSAGDTVKRPVRGLVAGTAFFDTTLGKPIWWDGLGWVDSTGASV